MDAAALAGLCTLLAQGRLGSAPPGLACPPAAIRSVASVVEGLDASLALRVSPAAAREGIARVAYAEAGDQGDSGLAAVVYTILNRLHDGRWGDTIDSVLNAHAQFEPVLRAGGNWRSLPAVSTAAQARIDTILNLALDGRLPDLTKGARYFQNPAIVAGRARSGQVSQRLVNFGDSAPSAVIGAHSFYVAPSRGGGAGRLGVQRDRSPVETTMFVGDNRAVPASGGVADASGQGPIAAEAGDPGRELFVSRQGRVSSSQP